MKNYVEQLLNIQAVQSSHTIYTLTTHLWNNMNKQVTQEEDKELALVERDLNYEVWSAA